MLECASGVVHAWLLGDEDICGRCVASEKFFIALANIDIAGQMKKPCHQPSKFQADENILDFWQEIVKFYKFKP